MTNKPYNVRFWIIFLGIWALAVGAIFLALPPGFAERIINRGGGGLWFILGYPSMPSVVIAIITEQELRWREEDEK